MSTVLALIDCRLGLEIARYLEARGELVGLVVHPSSKRTYITESNIRSFQCPVVVWPEGLDILRDSRPDFLLSVQFGYRVPKSWLEVPVRLPLNIHPGYLPDNRGRAPMAWPIMDQSRAGVTLHVMNEEFDAGPWIAREEVPVYGEDTGHSLAERVEATALSQFRRTWPAIEDLEPVPQEAGGTYHSLPDILNVELTDNEFQVLDKLL